MSRTGHLLFRLSGAVVIAASLGFVGVRLWAHRDALAGGGARHLGWILPALATAYGLSCFLLSAAWHRLLSWCGAPHVDGRRNHVLYARTQIAKYLPGNIFHLAGRHAWGLEMGIGNAPLAQAAVYEILSLLVVSGTLALAGTGLLGLSPGAAVLWKVLPAVAVFAVLPFIVNFVAPRLPWSRRLGAVARSPLEVATGLLPVHLLHLVFFLTAGLILLAVIASSAGTAGLLSARAIGLVGLSFALSWIMGFLTPGAPAGLGVREAVLVATLSGIAGDAESLRAALLFRMVTIGGDVVFFLLSFVIPGRRRPLTPPGDL